MALRLKAFLEWALDSLIKITMTGLFSVCLLQHFYLSRNLALFHIAKEIDSSVIFPYKG